MSSYPDALDTEFLVDAQFAIKAAENLGATPLGGRSIFAVTGGTFEGPRLRGVVRPGGGDWYLALANGAGELDVRLTLETGDGSLILLTYKGVLDVPPAVMARALAGEEVSPSEYYFRTAPRFETGSEKYAWLNKTVCVGVGRLGRASVGYRIFAVK